MPVMNPAAEDGLEFVIARDFSVPRERVFRAWTEVDQLRHWWGPKGYTVDHARLDPRPGGTFHYSLRGPDGSLMWGRFVFHAITAPERLDFTVTFSDPDGGLTRHPFNPDWPLRTRTTVVFDAQTGGTRLTIHWVPVEPTEAERAAFAGGHQAMHAGWAGTLDQLADYLART